MKTLDLLVICDNTQCKNYTKVVNTLSNLNAQDVKSISEGWGYGSEDVTTDSCPKCEILGRLTIA